MIKVVAVLRYPMKSMRGEAVHSIHIDARGLAGDRRLALIEQETGLVASAKQPGKWGRLLQCQATLPDDGVVRITLPSGRSVRADDPGIDSLLSEYVERDVVLSATSPEDPHLEREWPPVVGLAPAEVIASGHQITAMASAAPGTFFDYAPVHLLTVSTLAALRAGGDDPFDALRFRPNLILDTPGEGFVEQQWLGRQLSLGDGVVLEVIEHTPRCAVPSLAQGDLPRSPEVLRTVVAKNRVSIDGRRFGCVGVYARVVQGGVIRAGDGGSLD